MELYFVSKKNEVEKMAKRTNTFPSVPGLGAFCLAWPLAMVVGSTACAGTEQPLAASTFSNSIGVNTHFPYGVIGSSSVYQTANFTPISVLLINLGIQHIRDGMDCSYGSNPSGPYAAYDRQFKYLAANGIHASLTSDPRGDNNTQTPAMAVSAVVTMNANGAGIEAIEGPNELDDAPAGFTYNGATNFPADVIAYQTQLYAAFKGNPKTAGLTVIGPSEGKTHGLPSQNPLTPSSMYNYCDAGNFHAYSFGGNYATQHFTYDTINWYEGQGDTPSINIDPKWNLLIPVAQPPFALYNASGTMTAARPMYATEKGYFTGTAAQSVSQSTFAKYMPRVFADDMVAGIARTYSYELLDEPAYTTVNGKTTATTNPTDQWSNAGLIAVNSDGTFAPKPAYYTLQHLLQLLKDTGSSTSTSSLNYTLSFTYPAGYATASPNSWGVPTTIQHLLLQKSDGTYELLLWNDVSSAAIADTAGNALTSTARDIAVPTFPVTLVFNTPVSQSAVYYGLNPYGTTYATTLDTSSRTIAGGQITLNVPDYVTILEFTAVPEPTLVAPLAIATLALILRRPQGFSGH